MIYLYIGKNRIRLLTLSKTFLGQYNISHFKKTHENDLLKDGKITNVDLVASAIKEALTLAKPKEVSDKKVCLILPQDSFVFLRYDVPTDISEKAIAPFIRDKAQSTDGFDIEESLSDYLVIKQGDQSKVLIFGQKKDAFQAFDEAFKLLGLTVSAVIPETLSYFKLFEKTLRSQKKENILYASYESEGSFGYLYDSLGLLKPDKYYFTGEIKDALKSQVETLGKEGVSVNRVILSGSKSEDIRQDLFTKHVGVWTNPLKKIITNFYQDYLRIIVVTPENSFSVLDFDTCLGAFIFRKENKSFSILNGKTLKKVGKSISIPKFSLPSNFITVRDLVIFSISLALSFSAIYFFPKITTQFKQEKKVEKIKSPEPKKTSPTPTVTPTPSLMREDLKIKILNGSGIRGKAREVKEILQENGYGEIITGNAGGFDFAKTEIEVKEDKSEAIKMIKKDLEDFVTVEEKSIKDLDAENSADLILTVGQDFE